MVKRDEVELVQLQLARHHDKWFLAATYWNAVGDDWKVDVSIPVGMPVAIMPRDQLYAERVASWLLTLGEVAR